MAMRFIFQVIGAANSAAKAAKISAIRAFDATYNNTGHRVILNQRPGHSALQAFFGTQTKYRIIKTETDTSGTIFKAQYLDDANYYNWFEQIVFAVPRVAKNTVKLFTEFVPNFLAYTFEALGGALIDKAGEYTHASNTLDKPRESEMAKKKAAYFAKYAGYKLLILSCNFLGYLSIYGVGAPLMLATKILQSITSPIASMRQSYNHFAFDTEGKSVGLGGKILGVTVAAIRGLIAVAAYTAIAVFAAPIIGGWLAGGLTTYGGAAGAAIVSGVNSALVWVSSLPVVGAVGATVASGLSIVGSYLGLSTGVAFAAAATAAIAIAATPVLAGLRAAVRYVSPNKNVWRDLDSTNERPPERRKVRLLATAPRASLATDLTSTAEAQAQLKDARSVISAQRTRLEQQEEQLNTIKRLQKLTQQILDGRPVYPTMPVPYTAGMSVPHVATSSSSSSRPAPMDLRLVEPASSRAPSPSSVANTLGPRLMPGSVPSPRARTDVAPTTIAGPSVQLEGAVVPQGPGTPKQRV